MLRRLFKSNRFTFSFQSYCQEFNAVFSAIWKLRIVVNLLNLCQVLLDMRCRVIVCLETRSIQLRVWNRMEKVNARSLKILLAYCPAVNMPELLRELHNSRVIQSLDCFNMLSHEAQRLFSRVTRTMAEILRRTSSCKWIKLPWNCVRVEVARFAHSERNRKCWTHSDTSVVYMSFYVPPSCRQ